MTIDMPKPFVVPTYRGDIKIVGSLKPDSEGVPRHTVTIIQDDDQIIILAKSEQEVRRICKALSRAMRLSSMIVNPQRDAVMLGIEIATILLLFTCLGIALLQAFGLRID